MRRLLLLLRPLVRCVALVLVLVAVSGLYPGGGSASPPVPTGIGAKYVPGDVLFKLRDGTASLERVERALSVQELATATSVAALGIWKLKVAPGQELDRVRKLLELPDVEYAEPNYLAYALETPNDPDFDLQWGLTKINTPAAWDMTHGSADITIAVIDTGIDGTHGDLSGKVTAGYNFLSAATIAANTKSDDNGHGTHVAGIAAAITNNHRGVAGLSWESALMPLKVLDSSGYGSYEDVALGIRYAADHGAQVINLSLGGTDPSSTLQNAVNYAYGKGSLLLAAVGNCGYLNPSCGTPFYPAACANVMGIGATDSGDQRAWFSNYGPFVSVVAPGNSIYSTILGNGYGYKNGTSMACPYASGLTALIWSCSSYSNDQVRHHIEDTAVDLGAAGRDDFYGYGRIDALAAVRFLVSVSVSPSVVTFLADDETGPLPPSAALQIALQSQCGSTGTVSWTASISPTAVTWLTVAPTQGTISVSSPASLTLQADKAGLDHGYHDCQVVVSALTGTVILTHSTDVSLHYLEQLHRYLLFPVVKGRWVR